MKKTIIEHPSQLNELTTFRMFRKRGLGTIELSKAFEHPDKEALSKTLNKNLYACGCVSGARGLMLFLAGGLAVSLYFYFFNDMSMKNVLLFTGGASVAGAIIGKITGLLLANKKLSKTIHTIQAYWKTRDISSGEVINCG